MNAINRLRVIWVSTNVNLFLLMGLGYGIVFGGIAQGFQLAAGKTTVTKFIVSIIMYGAAYECMFLYVILIITVAVNIKGYISLGMDRQTIYKIWRDVLLYITTFIVLVFNLEIWINLGSNKPFVRGRALNINFNGLEAIDYLKIFVIIALAISFLNIGVSLITNIGNRFGLINSFAAIAFSLGVLIMSMPKIIELIMWGERFNIICVILAIINCILFWGSKNLIKNTEVAR